MSGMAVNGEGRGKKRQKPKFCDEVDKVKKRAFKGLLHNAGSHSPSLNMLCFLQKAMRPKSDL